jgi:hypothetical protein
MGKRAKREQIRAAIAANRNPPDRTISKLDAVRHLLHASIRLLLNEEDPFVVHMAAQSCDKLIIDLSNIRGIDTLDINRLLVPERADEFWHVYRESYNYFKHADIDVEEKLEVHNIIASNELGIFLNVVRSTALGLPYDKHSQIYMTYILSYYPDVRRLVNIELFPGVLEIREHFKGRTRSEMMDLLRELCAKDAEFLHEKEKDLVDVRIAGRERLGQTDA